MSIPQCATQTESCSLLETSAATQSFGSSHLHIHDDAPAAEARTVGIFRRMIQGHFSRVDRDQLILQEGDQQQLFGQRHEAELSARICIHSSRFYRKAVWGGSMGAAESYMDGDWSCDSLTSFMRVMLRNEQVLDGVDSLWSCVTSLTGRIRHWLNRNSRIGSRRNIGEHYDLGNDFFRLFLDETMMYSSAIFESPQSQLRDASLNKLDRVCRSLKLSPADRVVEIGTGWGGFAIYAARNYGCHVTTTTISNEQYVMACRRVQEEGLSDRVTVLLQDYRDLKGNFDKLVSLEMIEAVGRQYLPQYFKKCDSLLSSRGAMLIQAITMPEQRFARYAKSVDFIQKYVFPGGFLPSVTEMQNCIRTSTSLRLLSLEDFGLHYALTLRHWNHRFHGRIEEVKALGFSERFIRMWRYYLCYCEAAFLERATGVVQAVWAKPESPIGLSL